MIRGMLPFHVIDITVNTEIYFCVGFDLEGSIVYAEGDDILKV